MTSQSYNSKKRYDHTFKLRLYNINLFNSILYAEIEIDNKSKQSQNKNKKYIILYDDFFKIYTSCV